MGQSRNSRTLRNMKRAARALMFVVLPVYAIIAAGAPVVVAVFGG